MAEKLQGGELSFCGMLEGVAGQKPIS